MIYKVNPITLYNKIMSLCYLTMLSIFSNIIIILDLSLINCNNGNIEQNRKRDNNKIIIVIAF